MDRKNVDKNQKQENRKRRDFNRNGYRRKSRKKISVSRILAIVTSFISIILIIYLVSNSIKINNLKKDTQKLIDLENQYKNKIENLTKEIEKANSLEYIEKKAREDLGMIKKDEKIYIDKNSVDEKNTKSQENQEEIKNE